VAAPEVESVAKGTFAERPFARLLYFLYRKKVTGRLAIVDDSGDKSIVFLREGSPVHVDRPNEIDRLDRVLTDTGAVSRQKIAEAEAARAASGRRLGDLLEDMGALRKDELAAGLRFQLRRKLTRLFFQQKASFEVFLDDHHFGDGEEFEATRVDPRNILYPGIRAAYDDARLDRELAQFSDRIFRMGKVSSVVLEEMGFLATDQPVLAKLRDPGIRFEDLGKAAARPFDAKVVVLSLLYADSLELRSPTQPGIPALAPGVKAASLSSLPPKRAGAVAPGAGRSITPVPAAPPPPQPPPQPAAPSRPHAAASSGAVIRPQPAAPSSPVRTAASGPIAASSKDELRARVAALAAGLDKMGHFEVLGLPDTARGAEVGTAYLALVKQYHPDRMAGLGLGDLRPECERIVGRATEANAVLSDDAKRMQYLKTRKISDADRAKAIAVLEAELHFQKGEVLLKKGDFVKAEEAFTESVRLNPDEPEHKALLAWTRFANPASLATSRAQKRQEAVAALQEAIKARHRFARGHFFLGLIFKQKDEAPKAEEAFAAALREDPAFVEAERELRLIRMRKGGGGGGGFLDRLRKR